MANPGIVLSVQPPDIAGGYVNGLMNRQLYDMRGAEAAKSAEELNLQRVRRGVQFLTNNLGTIESIADPAERQQRFEQVKAAAIQFFPDQRDNIAQATLDDLPVWRDGMMDFQTKFENELKLREAGRADKRLDFDIWQGGEQVRQADANIGLRGGELGLARERFAFDRNGPDLPPLPGPTPSLADFGAGRTGVEWTPTSATVRRDEPNGAPRYRFGDGTLLLANPGSGENAVTPMPRDPAAAAKPPALASSAAPASTAEDPRLIAQIQRYWQNVYGKAARAGYRYTRDGQEEALSGGSEAGPQRMPGPWDETADPTRFLTDPKARDRFYNEQAKLAGKRQQANEEAIAAAQGNSRLADEFMQANENLGTGGAFRWMPGSESLYTALDSDAANMDRINAQLTPSMRVPGSGATSDFDARMFQRSTLGLANPREVNRSIATGIKAREQLTRDRAEFEDWYYANAGSLTGAETAWQRYLDANPIFDPESQDTPRLNSRRENWRAYFDRIYGGGNRSVGRGQPGGAVQINTDEEWDALAPGTRYVGPDGEERVK